jgi:sulfate transport system permease protein
MITKIALRVFGTAWVGLLVGLPIATVAYRALAPGIGKAWDSVFTPAGTHALVLTVEETLVAVTLNTVFGIGVALVLARHRFRGAGILELIIDMPLALSPVVIGLALILCYSSTEGWIGPWLSHHGIAVIFSFPGIVAASAFVSLPYVAREILPVLQELGTEQEQAAETLGAGPWRVFLQITLPAIRWGLAYGVLLTTTRILGEYGAVTVVSGNIAGKTQTFTQYVGTEFNNLDTAGAFAGALLLAIISMAVLALLSISRRKEHQLR